MLRKVILCPNPYRDAQLRVAKEAKRVLDEVGCPNVVCLPFRNQEPPEGYGLNIEPLQQEIRGADMIIAFGGDGTILHLSKTAAHRDIPVLGVNLGSLGFMAELESKDLLRLRDLCDGKYEIESHMMLDVSVQRDGRVIYSNLALNEALIAQMQEEIGQLKEINVDLSIEKAKEKPQQIEVEIAVEDGYSFEDISALCQQAVGRMMERQKIGQGLFPALVCREIFTCEGVENCRVKLPAQDLYPLSGEIFTLSDCTICRMARQ